MAFSFEGWVDLGVSTLGALAHELGHEAKESAEKVSAFIDHIFSKGKDIERRVLDRGIEIGLSIAVQHMLTRPSPTPDVEPGKTGSLPPQDAKAAQIQPGAEKV